MTKAELIDRIARSRDLPPDISKKLIGQILGVAFDELASYFARTRVTRAQSPRFTFPRFGTFTKKRRSARRGVNPRTLEPIQIEACNTIDFKVSRELREAMNPVKSGEVSESETRSSTRVRTRSTAKSKTNKKASAKRTAAKSGTSKTSGKGTGGSRRRLTPRDDEEELAAIIEQDPLFDAEDGLAPTPMQRVKGRRRPRSRGTG
ncbi:MAG: HU family DNA-binding protein [Deltaproteobacteria bacterium]|nr:HU family DNA-binding protein [Deltaproteobacteria bacterium]